MLGYCTCRSNIYDSERTHIYLVALEEPYPQTDMAGWLCTAGVILISAATVSGNIPSVHRSF